MFQDAGRISRHLGYEVMFLQGLQEVIGFTFSKHFGKIQPNSI